VYTSTSIGDQEIDEVTQKILTEIEHKSSKELAESGMLRCRAFFLRAEEVSCIRVEWLVLLCAVAGTVGDRPVNWAFSDSSKLLLKEKSRESLPNAENQLLHRIEKKNTKP
jgi:hypothetical protein